MKKILIFVFGVICGIAIEKSIYYVKKLKQPNRRYPKYMGNDKEEPLAI